MATAIAIGAGLWLRDLLLQVLPGMILMTILMRATILCTVGIGIYLALAQLFGIRELARLQQLLMRRLNTQRPGG